MRFAARFFLHWMISLLLFFLFIPHVLDTASAQTVTQQTTTNPAVILNTESDVPLNQHTYVQSMFIEFFVAIECQLIGIDLTNPEKSCLGINLDSGKLGYAPPSSNTSGYPAMGGLLGMLNSSIGALYTPAYSTRDYVQYLANNFGVQKTYAAPSNAFEGFSPILNIWKISRDISYFLLTIAFIFIGIGVMMRIHIDPRTVMTVQNQIPRVIIAIILITFSYAFAALLADTMWVVTYMGINKLTQTVNPGTFHVCQGDVSMGLAQYATSGIIQTPIGFVNDIFADTDCTRAYSGIFQTSIVVALNLSAIEWQLLLEIIGIRDTDCTAGGALASLAAPLVILGGPITTLPVVGLDFIMNGGGIVKSVTACIIGVAFGNIIKFFAAIAWFLIVTIIIFVSLFRLWFELLKAYLMILLYVIVAPLWIVFGLLPKRPLGFEKWLRAYFANLAVFPATVFLLILARIFAVLFNANPDKVFIPPLIGNPYAGNFGSILEFGMLIMAPTLLSIIRDKIGSPPLKQAAAIGQSFTAGRTAVGGLAGKTWQGLNRRNPTTGAGESAIPQGLDSLKARGKRFLFERGKGILASKTGDENFAQKLGGDASERATNLAEGVGRVTNAQRYGSAARNQPGNRDSVKALDDAMLIPARARSVEDESTISRFSHLMSDEQRKQRAEETLNLEITLKTPDGHETRTKLSGDSRQASQLVIDSIDSSTVGGQHTIAEMQRQAGTEGGKHWNKSLEELSPLEAKRVEEFLASNSAHLKPPAATPPPGATGGSTD